MAQLSYFTINSDYTEQEEEEEEEEELLLCTPQVSNYSFKKEVVKMIKKDNNWTLIFISIFT